MTERTSQQPIASIPHAATVVLVRDAPGGPQVLLTKRAAGLSFMANLWVFPGGRMESSDKSPAARARIAGESIADRESRVLSSQGTPLDLETIYGLHVAACRETFEEAGVMLGQPRSGAVSDAAQLARLASRRADASTGDGFLRLLEEEDLLLRISQLTYWSHWITPAREGKRFDTRFFVVQVPLDQQASADLSELTHHAWLTREELQAAAGSMQMAPPTRATLDDLWDSYARHGTLAQMLRVEQSRAVPPILPKFVEATMQVLLPWDPEYSATPGEGYASPEGYPPHLTRLPSRWPARALAARKKDDTPGASSPSP